MRATFCRRAAASPELRQNQFGGSIGGPIYKDRTFFFGDYEGFREVSGLTYTKTTLTQNEYNDVNSLNGGSPAASAQRRERHARSIAADPIALAYLKLYPAPNAGAAGALSNNYITSPNRTQSSNSFDVRIDHKFNDRNFFFGRYDYNKVNTFTPPGLGMNAATGLRSAAANLTSMVRRRIPRSSMASALPTYLPEPAAGPPRRLHPHQQSLPSPQRLALKGGADAIVSGGLGTFASNLNSQIYQPDSDQLSWPERHRRRLVRSLTRHRQQLPVSRDRELD